MNRTQSWRAGTGISAAARGGSTDDAGSPLADVRARVLPLLEFRNSSRLANQPVTLVVAHGNPLRMIRMIVEQMMPAQVRALDITTGVALHYDKGDRLVPLLRGGVYL